VLTARNSSRSLLNVYVNQHSVDRRITVVAKELVRLRGDQHYLEDRLEAMEELLRPKAKNYRPAGSEAGSGGID